MPIKNAFFKLAIFSLLFQGALILSSSRADAQAPTQTAKCQKDGDFNHWLEDVKREALSRKISKATLNAALPEMTYDATVVARDRRQGVFQQSFIQFAERMATSDRMIKGQRLIAKNRALFNEIEKTYGVPASVLVSFWGLETDFGAFSGDFPIIRAVTTLAYDCRRADFFREQLFNALALIEQGDLKPQEMIGNWAGELGGMQFTPEDYFKFGVDADGDGHRDLIHSVPDTLASGANFLAHLGWRRGEPWLLEVKVPNEMPWKEADMAIQHNQNEWQNWGVRTIDNRDLPLSNLPSSLILPMGHLGPAFLAYPNFSVFLGWNSAMVYATTAAYLATRVAGAPKMSHGNGVVQPLTPQQAIQLQTLLTKKGYSIGVIDGKIGASTRPAIKAVQLEFGLPADSYPTVELLNRLSH